MAALVPYPAVHDAAAAIDFYVHALGAVEREVTDQPRGGRSGWIVDPYGHRWNISSPAEPTTLEQSRERVGGSYQISTPDQTGPDDASPGHALALAARQS